MLTRQGFQIFRLSIMFFMCFNVPFLLCMHFKKKSSVQKAFSMTFLANILLVAMYDCFI